MIISCQEEKPAVAPSPPVVEVDRTIQKDVPVFAEWVATADGFVNATIRAQVQGYLIRQNYTEGDVVKKGQVLFEIDPRSFQAVLEQARGQLAQQQARWDTAKANLTRISRLVKEKAVSQKDYDDAMGAEQSTHAAVLEAQAGVDKAKLELDFTKITSPIAGIAGIAKAQLGNLVGPGSIEELTTVSTVDPIKVYIPVSEQEYLKAGGKDPQATRRMPLELILADGRVYPHKGEMAFADRQVDVRTGTIKIAALFPNPGNILRPGQFVRVRAQTKVRKDAVLVPQRAVMELQGSYQVALIDSENKVTFQPVTVAERVGNLWVIEKGLQPGQTVIVEGVQKVRQGMTVTPKPFGVSATQLAPVSPVTTATSKER
jgi:membrane fusion protein (multidrug efflux system)